jgi:signal peptidase I
MAYGYSYASCPSVPFTSIDAHDICGFLDGDNTRFWSAMPERGDVVVFRHPVTGEDYIKRLIGLPGDRIEVRDGRVIIDGEPVPQEPAGQFAEAYEPQGPKGGYPSCIGRRAPAPGEPCLSDRYIETLPNGVRHDVLDLGNTPADNPRGVFSVPEGHFFFMGDNRDDSLDSRFSQAERGVGFVPFENLVGRADRVIFSSAGRSMLAFWTWRSDRFFVAIN